MLGRAEAGAPPHPIPARPYRTIVVPLDGSRLAEPALDQAVPLVAYTGATLRLVGIVPDPNAPGESDDLWLPITHDEAVEVMTGYLTETAHRLPSTCGPIETHIAYGQPAAGILDFSEEVAADLIVMSTHGRSGLPYFWWGSVALKVGQRARGPGLLIRA